ncbi:UNVERIFIED_CONTAM: hypothetical protein HDU68_005121, partial [Siphonaria sp. JEL0065]
SFEYSAKMDSFFKNIVQSDFYATLSQYSTPMNVFGSTQLVNSYGRFGKSVTVNTTEYGHITDANSIPKILKSLVKSGLITPSERKYYPLLFGPEYDSILGGCSVYCSYHQSLLYKKQLIIYSVQPHCSTACCSTANGFDSLTCVASHDLVESVTDPTLAGAGWLSTNFQEVGDICGDRPAQILGYDGVSYVVNEFWSIRDDACVVSSAKIAKNKGISHNVQAALAVGRRGGAVVGGAPADAAFKLTPQVPLHGSKCDVFESTACQRIDGVGTTFLCAYGFDNVWQEHLHWVEWFPYCEGDEDD